MSLRKNVWEDHPWPDTSTWRAGNAVDGQYTNRSAAGGQCVITENYHKAATWGVDLGDVVSISHIDIYYRTDNYPRNTIVINKILYLSFHIKIYFFGILIC